MATDAEIDELEAQIVADATSGVERVVVDGQDTQLASLKERIDALQRLQSRQSPNNSFGLSTRQLISPGCGG